MTSMVISLQPAPSVANETPNTRSAAVPDREQLTVHVSAVIVTAQAARRAANGWLNWDVGDRLLAGQPELVLSDKLMWRIPVKWSSPTKGVLVDRVCDMFVDALTGQVCDKDATAKDIYRHVEHAARAIQSTAS